MKKHSLLQSTARLSGIVATVFLAISAFPSAFAASGTWTGNGGDANWQNDANWTASPFPGTASDVFTSTEIATFALDGSGAVNLGGTLNIGSILFGGGGANVGSFSLGDADDTLNLTSAGSISVRGGVTSSQTVGVVGSILNLSTANNSTYSFLNFGSGALTVGGDVTANQSTGNTSILTLGGTGNGLISGVLSNAGSEGSNGLAVTKNGSGTWTLSGANTYTGATAINGGRLVLDFSTNTPVNSSSALAISGGTVVYQGKNIGTTAASAEVMTIGGVYSVNNLVLDSNGGSGVALTIDTLSAASGSTLQATLLDLSSSSGNSIAVTALGSNIGIGAPMTGNILMVGASGNRRASFIVRDANGYGFATISGETSGTISRLTTGTAVTSSNSGSGTNYRIASAGTINRTSSLNFQTLTIDTADGDITLNMEALNLAATANGHGILVTGSNNATISGTGNIGSSNVFHNYGTGTFTITLASSSFNTMFAGTGFTDFAGTVTSSGSDAGSGMEFGGGVVRLSKEQTLPNNRFIVSGGGVLEVGADLNGASAGDFTIAVGTAAGNIRFVGDSGISAAGADRVVNFGGSSANLTWGSAGFLTNIDGTTDGGYTLKLSSARSDANLTIENGIALGTDTSRVIDVANGSAATDATLSGVLSGSGATLTKTGAGTLELANENTYSGGTIVSGGTLVLGASGSISDSSLVDINAGATFDTTAQSFVMLGSQTFNFTLDPTGVGSSGLLNAGNLDISAGVVTFTMMGALDDDVYILANYTGSLVGSAFASVTAPIGYTINYSYGGNQIALEVIPEPSAIAMFLCGLGMLAGFQRMRNRR